METFIKPKRGGGRGGDFAIKRKFVTSSNGGEIISGKRGVVAKFSTGKIDKSGGSWRIESH